MSAQVRLSITFLDPVPRFNGRGEGGKPEWPPSPLRIFSAVVAAAASRWRGRQFDSYAVPALEWLERVGEPTVTAPRCHPGEPIRAAVPNNDLDKWARDMARRRPPDKQPSELKTLKTISPSFLLGGSVVHYDWLLTAEQHEQGKAHLETLKAAARCITHLGWGVDQAVGHATLLDAAPVADPADERWLPADDGGTPLRVPRAGTLADLRRKHDDFLGRLRQESFNPVPPLTAFAVVGYRRATDPPGRAWAAFRITSVDPDEPNPAFDTARRTRDVAAWVRHAIATVCDGWPFPEPVAGFVHGHDADGNQLKGDGADDRFLYLPLPTINPKLNRVESIRRVLVAAPPRFADRVEWVRRRLPGQDLRTTDGTTAGLLNILPTSDWVLRQYTGESRAWSTVTPVVMPGHDGGDPAKAEKLLRRAFAQSGLPPELADAAGLEWQTVGFRPGVDLARRYRLPEPATPMPTYHVRVRFPVPVRGPLAVGAGRYRGLGLFAAERSD